MQKVTLMLVATLATGAAHLQAQSLLDSIRTPEKAVATVNQTLEGTWLSELRPAGLPATAPALPNLTTFHPNGTSIASASDGNQSAAHGVWVRVGDRKYLATVFLFNYNESGVLTTILKARINLQVSQDGQTLKGTNEVVIMDRTGKILASIPGGSTSGVRLSPEIPGDFYEFQKVQ